MVLNLTKYFDHTTVVIVLMSAIDKWWMHYGYDTQQSILTTKRAKGQKNDVTRHVTML